MAASCNDGMATRWTCSAALAATLAFALFSIGGHAVAAQDGDAVGLFEKSADIGATARAGSLTYDPAAKTYRVAGGGENMWGATDAFHFAWKRAEGDVTLTADVSFVGTGGNAHRKACLMIRQALDQDAPYVDAALHGDGLTSLQWREIKGQRTYEVQANVSTPTRLRLEKRGAYVSMSLAKDGKELTPSGASTRLAFDGPFYVGLAVCAHDNAALEQANFSNVELTVSAPAPPAATATNARPRVLSTLETITLSSRDRRVTYVTPDLIEAPNWSKDDHLYFNSKGRMLRIPVAGGRDPELIDTGFAIRCNNDHGISPDGKTLAISDQSQDRRQSIIYTLQIGGGTPTRVTPLAPSYWHGWSPDGNTIVYCAERDGEFDVYSIPSAGGAERRLTTAKGLDDGPEYSPDGKFIYFNSDRTGTTQVWRMHPDGSAQEQVTNDDYNNWFPHHSPDGRWIVFLSYDKDVKGHPENKDVMLRLIPASGSAARPEVLAKLFGGQGTINVPSWSPDSRRLAFVSYQLVR